MRVLVCSIDGLRPDALGMARTPVIDRLISEGAYCPTAQSVMPSVTLPCHMSMLRGVDVPRHGINTNVFHPLARHVPSVIDVAAQAGLQCGFFYNWEPLRDCSDPGSLKISVLIDDNETPDGDMAVAQAACHFSRQQDLDLTITYFGNTDSTGHKYGWMSREYLDAVANVDTCIGKMLATLHELGRLTDMTILLLSDHGGHGRSHGTDMIEDMTIPWVLYGPSARRGVILTNDIRIYDTGPTIAHLLSLTPHPEWDGRLVAEALAD